MSAKLLRDPVCFLALGGGSGLAPRAPGTFGTLPAVPLVLWLQTVPVEVYAVVVAVMAAAGVPLCAVAEKKLNRRDHPAIVWDEITGFTAAMLFAPAGLAWLAAGFVLFRAVDIFKPWPINVVNAKMHGGAGIMADDLLAAAVKGVVLFAAGAGW